MKEDSPKRGAIYWVRLDPTEGKEIKKTRTCIIISCNIVNNGNIIIVAPITSNATTVHERLEVKVNVRNRSGKIVTRQMRSIDKGRLGKKIGEVSQKEMELLETSLRNILSL